MGPDRTVEGAGVQDFCKSGLVLSRIESRVFWRTFNIFQRIIFDTTSLKIFTQFGQHDPDLIESGWRNGERNAETNGEGCVQISVYNIQGSSGMIDKTPVNCRRCNFQAVYIVWERNDVFHEAFFHACYFEWTVVNVPPISRATWSHSPSPRNPYSCVVLAGMRNQAVSRQWPVLGSSCCWGYHLLRTHVLDVYTVNVWKCI